MAGKKRVETATPALTSRGATATTLATLHVCEEATQSEAAPSRAAGGEEQAEDASGSPQAKLTAASPADATTLPLSPMLNDEDLLDFEEREPSGEAFSAQAQPIRNIY